MQGHSAQGVCVCVCGGSSYRCAPFCDSFGFRMKEEAVWHEVRLGMRNE
jgi:hypothetical protein